MLVLIAALRDGRKVVLAVESGYRESTESWAALLRDLKTRGLRAPRLVIADGHLGIWATKKGVPTAGRRLLHGGEVDHPNDFWNQILPQFDSSV